MQGHLGGHYTKSCTDGFLWQFTRQGLPLWAMHLLEKKWKAAEFCKQHLRTGNLQQEMEMGLIDPEAREVTDWEMPRNLTGLGSKILTT